MRKLFQKLFFGTPTTWYIGGIITDDNRKAYVEWLEDRQRFHTWLTSIVTGAAIFLGTVGPPLDNTSASGVLRRIGLSVMMLSILANMVSIWSISNYKLNVKTRMVKEGSRLRLDIEIVAVLAAASFIIGFVLTVLPSVM